MDNINERIARWMGDEYIWQKGGNWEYHKVPPDYQHDADAALRVLARMESVSDRYGYALRCCGGWAILQINIGGDIYLSEPQPTPCAAICAAWEAVYGKESDV